MQLTEDTEYVMQFLNKGKHMQHESNNSVRKLTLKYNPLQK